MTHRRWSAPRRWAVGAVALVTLSVAGLAAANAAQLTVTSSGVAVASAARCTNGPVAITGGATHSGTSYSSVSVAGLASACSGKSVTVTVYNLSGTALWTGTGLASTVPFDITTVAPTLPYTSTAVTGVALLVGTWGVPATWTPPVVVPTACTAGPVAATIGTVHNGANYYSVALSGVPASCSGKAVTITVGSPYNSSITTGTGPASTGAFEIATGKYKGSDVTFVVLTIDGFTISTTWTRP